MVTLAGGAYSPHSIKENQVKFWFQKQVGKNFIFHKHYLN